jgi:hypothetical protein
MAPIVPGFTADAAKLEATVKAIGQHGAAFMGANVLFLKEGTRDHFMGFLAKEYPHLVESYNRLYAGPYAPAGYISAVRGMIDALQRRYDIKRRASEVPASPKRVEPPAREGGRAPSDVQPEREREPEQNAFEWDSQRGTS